MGRRDGYSITVNKVPTSVELADPVELADKAIGRLQVVAAIKLLAQGKSYQEVAHQLGVSMLQLQDMRNAPEWSQLEGAVLSDMVNLAQVELQSLAVHAVGTLRKLVTIPRTQKWERDEIRQGTLELKAATTILDRVGLTDGSAGASSGPPQELTQGMTIEQLVEIATERYPGKLEE